MNVVPADDGEGTLIDTKVMVVDMLAETDSPNVLATARSGRRLDNYIALDYVPVNASSTSQFGLTAVHNWVIIIDGGVVNETIVDSKAGLHGSEMWNYVIVTNGRDDQAITPQISEDGELDAKEVLRSIMGYDAEQLGEF